MAGGKGSDSKWYYKWRKEDLKYLLTSERTGEVDKTLRDKEFGAELDKWIAENPDSELARSIKALQLQQYSIFNDPIHGPVKLHPLLTKIINTTEFSRLRHIKQLGTACYVYHGAIHTRFEHSIGVCFLAGEFIRMLQQSQPELHINDKEVLCVEVAALCHDLGHGPFSHMFNRIAAKILDLDPRDSKYTHEKLSQLIFARIYKKLEMKNEFSRYGLDEKHKELIKALINPDETALKNERRFLYEIVANKTTGIDVDKWDYFERDGKYLHVPIDFQARRLMSLSRVILHENTDLDKMQYRICYRDKELQDIYGMFHTRCTLHQRAYQHKTVKAIDQMIADAIIAIMDVPIINIPSNQEHGSAAHSIKGILELAKKAVDIDDDDKGGENLDGYIALTDNLIELIKHGRCDSEYAEKLQEARELIRRVEERDIYHRIEKKHIQKLPKRGTPEQKIKTAQIEEEVIHQLNAQDAQSFKQKYYIEVVPISYGSEDEGDPLKKVLFYKKDKPGNALPSDTVASEKSKLIMPQAFFEHEIRLYRRGASNEAEDKRVKWAFNQWCSPEVENLPQQ